MPPPRLLICSREPLAKCLLRFCVSTKLRCFLSLLYFGWIVSCFDNPLHRLADIECCFSIHWRRTARRYGSRGNQRDDSERRTEKRIFQRLESVREYRKVTEIMREIGGRNKKRRSLATMFGLQQTVLTLERTQKGKGGFQIWKAVNLEGKSRGAGRAQARLSRSKQRRGSTGRS